MPVFDGRHVEVEAYLSHGAVREQPLGTDTRERYTLAAGASFKSPPSEHIDRPVSVINAFQANVR